MKITKILSLLSLIAVSLACGYGSKNYGSTAGMPTIAQLNPDAITAGGNAFMLTINGSNFSTKAVVNWNGIAQSSNTTYVTGNQLSVAIPASLIAASGMVQITVTNPASNGTGMYPGTLAVTSSPVSFTIN